MYIEIDKITYQLKKLPNYEIIQIREDEPAKRDKIADLIKIAQTVLG